MPFDGFVEDFCGALPAIPASAVSPRRRASGLGNYHQGLAAENLVARHYLERGLPMAARRWRGRSHDGSGSGSGSGARGGEIDLIFDDGDRHIFVEVKSSRSHDQAAGLIGRAQIERLYRAADAYIGQRHGHQDIDRRFDLALVDRLGRIELIENAFMLCS